MSLKKVIVAPSDCRVCQNYDFVEEKKNRLMGIRNQARCVWQKCLEHFISWLIPVSFCLLSSNFCWIFFFPQHSKITLLSTKLKELGVGTGQHPWTCWCWFFRASPKHAEPWRSKPQRLPLTGKRLSAHPCPQLRAWLARDEQLPGRQMWKITALNCWEIHTSPCMGASKAAELWGNIQTLICALCSCSESG